MDRRWRIQCFLVRNELDHVPLNLSDLEFRQSVVPLTAFRRPSTQQVFVLRRHVQDRRSCRKKVSATVCRPEMSEPEVEQLGASMRQGVQKPTLHQAVS